MSTDTAVTFVHAATLEDFAGEPQEHLRARILDTLAATTAGFQLPTVDVIRAYAATHHDGDSATVLGTKAKNSGDEGKVDNESLSEHGAVLVNATAANALDVDDGHRAVKGHPAAVVIPPALAVAETTNATVGAFLTAVGIGYELAVRAGLAIHETADSYTGTGSWGAVGGAAAVARLRGLDASTTATALGIAEYHAPRTPILRGVEHPGMTKDGIGWGAYTGLAAVDLAMAGFTASKTVFDAENVTVTDDLGSHFHLTAGYLKPYPCCRWAQPGIDAVLGLCEIHDVESKAVESVRVHTFEAATHLQTRHPETAEEAEYSYPYPVAAALVSGRFTPTELSAEWRENPEVRALAERVELLVDRALEDRFPAECLARIELITSDDRVLTSDVTRAQGARERPLSHAERRAKAADLFGPLPEVTDHIERTLESPKARITTLLDPWRG